MMVIDNKFEIADIVYLRTDADQAKRVVTSIHIRPNEQITYELSCGSHASDHYDFEISEEKSVLTE